LFSQNSPPGEFINIDHEAKGLRIYGETLPVTTISRFNEATLVTE
jgi:hypothetical protein